MFNIHMGIPEMKEFWDNLSDKIKNNKASKDEIKLYNLLGKTLVNLANNPKYPALKSHEISALTLRYGIKVWESYFQNNSPSAGRIFWVYGPNKDDITIIGIEPHPNDSKSNAYKKIVLSSTKIQCGCKVSQ